MSVLPTHCTTRRGNKVSQSRLPVSLRHCPGWPSATTCGHHRWDWALPHGSRKQRTHSTQLYSITVTNSVRVKSAFYAQPGAHQSSVPDTPPQRLRSRGRCQRSCQSSIVHFPRLLLFIQRVCPRKKPRVIFQLRALQPSECHPCRHWHLLLDHGLGPPPAH